MPPPGKLRRGKSATNRCKSYPFLKPIPVPPSPVSRNSNHKIPKTLHAPPRWVFLQLKYLFDTESGACGLTIDSNVFVPYSSDTYVITWQTEAMDPLRCCGLPKDCDALRRRLKSERGELMNPWGANRSWGAAEFYCALAAIKGFYLEVRLHWGGGWWARGKLSSELAHSAAGADSHSLSSVCTQKAA